MRLMNTEILLPEHFQLNSHLSTLANIHKIYHTLNRLNLTEDVGQDDHQTVRSCQDLSLAGFWGPLGIPKTAFAALSDGASSRALPRYNFGSRREPFKDSKNRNNEILELFSALNLNWTCDCQHIIASFHYEENVLCDLSSMFALILVRVFWKDTAQSCCSGRGCGWSFDQLQDTMYRKYDSTRIKAEEEEVFSSKRCLEWFYEYAGTDDIVGPEGMEKFCEDIGVEPENVVMLVLAWKLDAQNMGYFTLQEWLKGMTSLQCDTTEKLRNSLDYLRSLLNEPTNFKLIYRYAFDFARQSKYKVINKDQWCNVLEFSRTINLDLSNYDEDGACSFSDVGKALPPPSAVSPLELNHFALRHMTNTPSALHLALVFRLRGIAHDYTEQSPPHTIYDKQN
ncbi:hypothetical protein IHE44_0013014 [Lamprotornis superbus]|uniref:DCN1-like protein n=1 Tax=Lamprotornis superbus TaxID=245042 RepID=A0A835P796_9PASS|nr:hypothetical protein IHE44_0013014 [Lamprotornis superbus]